MRAIPEHLRGVITTRRYTNPRLPLPLPYNTHLHNSCNVSLRAAHHYRHCCHASAALSKMPGSLTLHSAHRDILPLCSQLGKETGQQQYSTSNAAGGARRVRLITVFCVSCPGVKFSSGSDCTHVQRPCVQPTKWMNKALMTDGLHSAEVHMAENGRPVSNAHPFPPSPLLHAHVKSAYYN